MAQLDAPPLTRRPASASAVGSALGGRLRRISRGRLWREPLVHFLVLGALIFALAQWREQAADPRRIVVDRQRVDRLTQAYVQQYGEAPSPAALDELVDRWVEQEALYREGKAMGLDQEDEVVRRRIVQKTEFLQQDLNPPAEPDEAALRRWHAAHPGLYRTPALATFSHVYFASEAAGEAAAEARARTALAALDADVTRAPERGDPFPDHYDYAGVSAQDAVRIFGRSAFTEALFAAPVGHWAGPYRSGYGWHLVRVGAVAQPEQRTFDSVREAVRTDLLAAERAAANRRAMDRLLGRYDVVVRKDARR